MAWEIADLGGYGQIDFTRDGGPTGQ